jgi:uncharacterized protein (TIGR02444 family)
VIASAAGDIGKLEYDNEFWRFSLAVYGEPAVAEECLTLQQAIGIDVNLLLFCAWTGTQDIVLTAGDIKAAVKKVAAWQEHVVRPLRTARQQLKALGYDEFESFRSRIKSTEIEAEQIEQAMLFAYSRSLQNSGADVDRRDAVAQNVAKYIRIKSGSQPAWGLKLSVPHLIDAALRMRSLT